MATMILHVKFENRIYKKLTALPELQEIYFMAVNKGATKAAIITPKRDPELSKTWMLETILSRAKENKLIESFMINTSSDTIREVHIWSPYPFKITWEEQ